MVKEKLILLMEVEITVYKKDENFDLCKISRLIDSNFSKIFRKFYALIPTSLTGPLLVAMLLAVAFFTSPLSTFGH